MKKNGLVFKKGKSNSGDVIKDTLINHGINENDISFYKNISSENIPATDPSQLNNMNLAYKRVKKAIDGNESIGILVDGDADGMASASLLYKALSQLTNNVSFYTAETKTHGLAGNMVGIINNNYDLLLTPDASSNDKLMHMSLKFSGTDVVVLDHHIINNSDHSDAIIVNNQNNDNNNTNTNYVGVGMSYLFIRYYNSIEHVFNEEDFLSLFAFGQITDMSDISDYEIRSQVIKGLKLFGDHKLFKWFDLKENVSPHDIAFKVAPKINAVSRVGTLKQRLNLLYALSEVFDEDDITVVTKKRKDKNTGLMKDKKISLNPYQLEMDSLIKTKSLQDRTVKKADETIEYIAKKDSGLVIAKIDSDINSSITGLIANRIVSRTQAPALVIRENDGKFIGSMRCPGIFEMRTWLNNTGVVQANGHEQASGVEINFKDINSLIEKSKTDLDISQPYYLVDKELDEFSTSQAVVREINNNIEVFGGKVKEPELGFKSIPFNKSGITKRGSVLNMVYNNLSFVMFNGSDVIEYITEESGFSNEVYFDILGNASENEWYGKTTPQIIIKEIAVSNKKELTYEKPEDMVF